MGAEDIRRDPIGAILQSKGDSAKIVTDTEWGYDRIYPKPDLLSDMESLFADEIKRTDDDYAASYEALDKAEAAYEAASDEGELPKITTVKRIVNQQHAWTSTAILTKNPIVSVKPLDGGSYTIPAQLASPSPDGSPNGATYDVEELGAAEAANLYEQYLQYKFTEKLPFEQLVDDTIMAIHIGEAPTWWKIYYNPKVRIAKQRQFIDITGPGGKKQKQLTGVVDVRLKDGEAISIDHVSFRNITMPMDCGDDEQATPWLAERTPMTNSRLWEGFLNKEFDLAREKEPTEDEMRVILGFAEDLYDKDATQEMRANAIDHRVAQAPNYEHDIRTLWFFWPLRVTRTQQAPQLPGAPPPDTDDQSAATDTDGAQEATEQASAPPDQAPQPAPKSTSTIEIRSLCGLYHMGARQFLTIYNNPNWRMKRPYVPFFMRKKPHRFTGWTAASDLAPLADLTTAIYHLQINNGVQQNIKIFTVRNNSISHITLKKSGNQLRPGMILPYDDPKDITPVQLGAPIESMHMEISFLNTEAERLGVVNDYDLGAEIPNRTAAMTVGQIQQMAKMQPQTILRSIRRSISKAVEMYLSLVCQYHVLETIPYLDERTNRLMNMLISFPQDAIENHFSFHVTATGDEDTSQGRIEKLQLLLDATDKANDAAMKLGEIIIDPSTPPPAAQFALSQLIRREALYKELVSVLGPQYGKFAFTEDKLSQLMKDAQAYAQQKAQEEANKPPAPPKVDVAVSLKGVMPPDQEAALASQALGINVQPQGAGNEGSQLQPPVPGGSIPQPQPAGPPGPGAVQPQLDNAGMAPQDALGNPPVGAAPVGVGQ